MELSIYNITNGFIELMDKAANGEITEEEYNSLNTQLKDMLVNKSTSSLGYIRNSELLIDAMKEEEKRISDMRKSAENKLNKFKEYLKTNMDALGIQKIETPVGTLSLAKSPVSVEIEDESLVPDDFKETVTTVKINKKAITDNFKETGEIPDGVIIHTDNTNLRIK